MSILQIIKTLIILLNGTARSEMTDFSVSWKAASAIHHFQCIQHQCCQQEHQLLYLHWSWLWLVDSSPGLLGWIEQCLRHPIDSTDNDCCTQCGVYMSPMTCTPSPLRDSNWLLRTIRVSTSSMNMPLSQLGTLWRSRGPHLLMLAFVRPRKPQSLWVWWIDLKQQRQRGSGAELTWYSSWGE